MVKIVHFPVTNITFRKEKDNNIPLEKNISLSIITSFTEKDKAILVTQLENNGIEYINAGDNIIPFIKGFKPVYYSEALKNVDSEYVLIIDSYDTIIYNIDEMPSCLEYYGKDMLYSSWDMFFPSCFNVQFSVPEENRKKYLCSGIFFGKTSAVKEFYDKLANFIKKEYDVTEDNFKWFEQYWIYRFLFENKGYLDKLGIDYDEQLVKTENFIIQRQH